MPANKRYARLTAGRIKEKGIMKLTAIEKKQATTTDYIGQAKPTRRVAAMGKHSKKSHSMPLKPITPEERQSRKALLDAAMERLGGVKRIADALGINSGSVSGWVNDKYPVPEKHLGRLKEIAK